MNNPDNNEKNLNLLQERKILVKNLFYSYLKSYSMYLFSIITSFLLARLVSPQSWGLLIVSLSFISIISLIISFLPPGLVATLLYYIPRHIVAKEKSKLKSIIKHAFIQKILFVLPFFIIFIFFLLFLPGLFSFLFKGHINLLFILSPLLIITSLDQLLNGINLGFNLFKTVYILSLIKDMFYIFALIFLHLFIDVVDIAIVAIFVMLSYVIPFLINCYINLANFMKISSDKPHESYKEFYQKVLNYGTYVAIGDLGYNLWNQVKTQSIGIFEGYSSVTGYNISDHYASVPRIVVQSKGPSLSVAFTRLDKSKNYDQMKKIFNTFFYYGLFLFLLVNGVFYLSTDFFITIVYTESYLQYSNILKLMLISLIFYVLGGEFQTLLLATNKVKFIPKLRLIALLINIPLFFIGLGYYGIYGALIGIFSSNLIVFFIIVIYCYKMFNMKLDLKKITLLYSSYLISLIASIYLEHFIFYDLRLTILNNLNLLIFKHLPILSIIIFLVIYMTMNILLKVFSYQDLIYIEEMFNKENRLHTLIRRILNFFKRILYRNDKKA